MTKQKIRMSMSISKKLSQSEIKAALTAFEGRVLKLLVDKLGGEL